MPSNPSSMPQIPLDRVTQVLYAKIFAAMESVRARLADATTATEGWVAVFAEFRDSLPELNLPAYHELRTKLGCVSDAFARGVNAPLRDETRLLAMQVVEHDLPRVAAIAAKLNEEEAPKFFSVLAKNKPEMTLAYFDTPDVKPKTRIRKADFDRAISTILRTRMEELDRLIREDTAAWLRAQGITGDAFEIVEGDGPQYVFRKRGDVWEVIFEGRPPFFVRDTLGAKYIDYLLHKPNEAISARDLEIAVNKDKRSRGFGTSGQTQADGEAIRQYLRDLERLRGEKEQAVEDEQAGDIARIDKEIEDLEAAVEAAGNLLAAGDAGENARTAVSKAISAVTKKLKQGEAHEKAFAEHLGGFLDTGYSLIYRSEQGRIWQ